MVSLESTLFVIPARGGSKGIPKKNLRKIHGKSLTEWALIVANRFPPATVALSSDSQEILQLAEGHPGTVPVLRPASISKDTSTDQEALSHALQFCESMTSVRFETIVMLQPTAPSRTVELIQEALVLKESEHASSVWSVDLVDLKLHARKQLHANPSGEVRLVVDSTLPLRRQDLTPTFIRNGECYVLSRDLVMNDAILLGANARIVVSSPRSVNIDTLADLELAEQTLKVGQNGILVKR